MRHLILILLFCGAVSQTALADATRAPASIEEKTSWKTLRGSKVEVFNSKTLSSYRPHDSTIILEYGFAKLTKAQLIRPEQKPLTVAIYEMLDSAAAYGLFTYLRPPTAERLTESAVPVWVLPGKSAFIKASTTSWWARNPPTLHCDQPCCRSHGLFLHRCQPTFPFRWSRASFLRRTAFQKVKNS